MADQVIAVDCKQQSAERNVNENGEDDIIMEAKLSRWFYFPTFALSLVLIFLAASLLFGFIILILALPLLIVVVIISYFRARKWRLYLAQNSIHYRDASFNCCGEKDGGRTIVFPLTYIEYVEYRSTTVMLTMKRSNWMELMDISPSACQNETIICCCCHSTTVTYCLYYVRNSEDFTQAIRTCMGTASRQY